MENRSPLRTSWCAKRNKLRQNIKRQLSDHTADINLIIPWRFGAQSNLQNTDELRCLWNSITQWLSGRYFTGYNI